MPTFNNEASLRSFPKFQILSDDIQSIVLQMLKDDRLNSYGSLKRPPNAWLIFRSEFLAAHPEMSSMSQAEVTVRCKSRWEVATPRERMELQARARRANEELLQYFPDYAYKPVSKAGKERWNELGAHLRKDFWLSSAVRIAERIANPSSQWDGFLTLEKWAEVHAPAESPGAPNKTPSSALDPNHSATGRASKSASPPPNRLAPRLQRLRKKPGSTRTGTPSSTTNSSNATSSRFRPYNSNSSTRGHPVVPHEKEHVQIRRKAAKKILPPDSLRDALVHIGPPGPNSRRRRLILSMFQLMDKMVWVSEEMDDDVPDDVIQQLSNPMSPDEMSPDHLVLSDYTDPWIPEATDEDGELFYPEIDTVSEYHEYMEAYYFAQENSSDFIWPPPQSPSPAFSQPSPPSPPTSFPIPLLQTTESPHSALQNSSILGDPFLEPSAEISPPEMWESLPSTNRISDVDSDSVTTPEEDLGWDESMLIDIVEDYSHGVLEDFEFNFE